MDIVIRDTERRGRGVFALRRFASGELIETCPVLVVPAKELKLIDATVLYAYYFGWHDDGAIATGYGSFYNHSDEPNAMVRKDYGRKTLAFVSLRDIAPDEEITIRYNTGAADTPLWFDPV